MTRLYTFLFSPFISTSSDLQRGENKEREKRGREREEREGGREGGKKKNGEKMERGKRWGVRRERLEMNIMRCGNIRILSTK